MERKLERKTIVITGATSGIGLALMKKSLRCGAKVIGIGRAEDKILQAEAQINKINPEKEYTFLLADLASQFQIYKLYEDICLQLDQWSINHVDVLINNAGIYLEKLHLTEDGIEQTFAVNHLAGFLLSHLLMPYLNQISDSKILNISSYAHYTTPMCLRSLAKPAIYIGLLAYKRSKLCNVLFTKEFNRRFQRIKALAIDPGLVNTSIGSKGGQGISDWVWRRRKYNGMTPEESADNIHNLAAMDSMDFSQEAYYQNASPKRPSNNARNQTLANSLWTLSCQLTGIEW